MKSSTSSFTRLSPLRLAPRGASGLKFRRANSPGLRPHVWLRGGASGLKLSMPEILDKLRGLAPRGASGLKSMTPERLYTLRQVWLREELVD